MTKYHVNRSTALVRFCARVRYERWRCAAIDLNFTAPYTGPWISD